MMLQLFQFVFFLLCFPSLPLPTYSLLAHNFSTQHLCNHDDKMALLNFKNGFTVHPQFSEMYYEVQDYGMSYPKTNSWKENRDCCLWDGVTCDFTSGHVIGLDLSCSQLGGIIHHNSSLFHLSYLQSLNLAYNSFYPSHISSRLGHFSKLKVLNLSHTGFTGDVPVDITRLSQLVSLDLTFSSIFQDELYGGFLEMKIPHFDKLVRNLTNLRQLHLNSVVINSTLPQTLANLSLSSLQLYDCKLHGVFPSSILRLPHMSSLIVGFNFKLYMDSSEFKNLSSSLQVIDFSDIALSGNLPEILHGRQQPQLRQILLSNCNLSGTIPMWIWKITEIVSLNYNHLTGELPATFDTKELSQVRSISLSDNLIKGSIPSWLINLPSLVELNLGNNQFIGRVNGRFPKDNCVLEDLDLSSNNNLSLHLNVFSKCNNLVSINLSNVSLIEGLDSTYSWPNLSRFVLSFSNITEFPKILNSQQPIRFLDLSNNRIQGEISTWMNNNVRKDLLELLDMSHNNLTGNLDLLSWKSLVYINLRSNSLQGLLPLPPPNTTFFRASSNKFHGEITSSFCDLTQLNFVDLSNNHLNGKIPKCLGKLSHSLRLLDLGFNKFHGIIPMTFTEHCTLTSIHLNNNQLEGTIPLSLKRCKSLEVLDLGNNRFNDSFPHWLDSLPELKVLVLRLNNFQGSIREEQEANKHSFPKLQILDLSNNQFSGKLPARYIKNFKAFMVHNGDEHMKDMSYINNFGGYYQESLELTMKGLSLTYQILTILVALDFSNNKFIGEIPNSVGELVALVALNVSHNQLTGHIPASLSKLTALQSLDLSCNKLEGNIPTELVGLTFLEVFNVSQNRLTGHIPQGSQFSTFLRNSYEGNSGLCGDPMPPCGKGGTLDPLAASQQDQDVNDIIDIITSISLWEVIVIGFGLGATLGLVAGYLMLSSERPNWFSRRADRLESVMVQRSKKRSRRQQRRT